MEFKKISIFVVLLFITAGSIYYLSENTASETDVPKERQGPYVDSLAPDNRPSITARRDTVPQPVGENLAPGNALLRVTIIDIGNTDNKIDNMRVRVDEVLGYGSSTPPIAKGTEFVFNIAHYLKKNSKFNDQLNEQSTIRVLVSHQKGMQLKDNDNKQDWTFVEISEK